MDEGILMIAGMVGLVALVLAVLGLLLRSRARQLGRPPVPIAQAQPGPVRLAGRVDGEELFHSHVSNQDGIYLRVRIVNEGDMGDLVMSVTASVSRSPTGRAIRAAREASPGEGSVDQEYKPRSLTLDDGTGQVELDLEHSEFELLVDRAMKTNLLMPDDPEVLAILRRYGVPAPATGAKGVWRIQELLLDVSTARLGSSRPSSRVSRKYPPPKWGMMNRIDGWRSAGARRRAGWA